ncbi:hypothetical protein EV643_10422 [Kribbella sp. VKM Ac-2527]|uniref:Uncharacterized protein n=1 Tax=Kribbella caucasensis TaxID=2512215 RepID=A0A4R6KHH8_9ACTN|nr:hypothetical protein EV643_10422 [Kribbella sp. VKM Ac-2527]
MASALGIGPGIRGWPAALPDVVYLVDDECLILTAHGSQHTGRP